jgi:uncharacterized protein (DUF1778 family)
MSAAVADTLERPAPRNRDSRRSRATRRETTINFRVSIKTRDLLDAAAEVVGKTRTQFVVDSAQTHAIDVLLDQRFFRLDENAFAAFMAVLDNPPEPNPRLRELLAKKAPWET